MPKKYVVVKFTSLPDPMCGIRCNKKTFSVDVTEDTYAGGKRWVLVFYGLNSKLLDYYRLGLKNHTASLTLDSLGQFNSEHGVPRKLVKGSHSILGAGNKWKQVLWRKFILLFLSEPDKRNQNPVKRAIQKLKSRCSKISNSLCTGVLAYHYETMEYLCNVDNYIS